MTKPFPYQRYSQQGMAEYHRLRVELQVHLRRSLTEQEDKMFWHDPALLDDALLMAKLGSILD